MTKSANTNDTNEVVTLIREGDKIGILMFLRQGGDPNARNHMGWTLLHLACLEGQAEIAEILLDAGAMVNCCTTDMCTPLHLASARGNKKSVEVLAQKGAYINAQDKTGNTPLHEAAKAFHTSIVKFLLEKKADKDKKNKKGQIFIDLVGQQLMPTVECGDAEELMQWLEWGLNSNTVGNLHWSLLHHASARGQINIASLLLEKGADVNVLDSNKSSPLHAASFHGHKRIAELLLGRGANINAQDQMGNTPLHSAISGGHPDVINLLLEAGCDTTIANKEGQIFTHLVNEFLIDAVEKGRVAHVISILKGRANPDTKDPSGYPILCCAAFKGDVLVVDALLEAGADPNICSGDTQKTGLHYAACIGNLFVLKALLDKNASVSSKDKTGLTPLHEAVREGDHDVVTVLIGRGAALNAQDNEGNTPLHIAARWGQSTVVEMLLEKGAIEDIRNKDGMLYSDLALMRAVRTEDASQVMAGLAWGGCPDIQDAKGWTLLHHAVYKSAHEVCFVLLESEANVNIADKHGRTALLLAAYRGNKQIVEMLLDAGADPNARDLDNQTPLHWAAGEGSIDCVELLLSKGANRNIRNKKGLLFTDLLLKHLYFAVRHNDEDKVEALLRAGADQTAELTGTGTTPREEAKRKKCYPILRKMVSLAPPKPPKRVNKEEILMLEDVRKLFEGHDVGDDGTSDESSSSTGGDEEEIDPDEDAYWKMHNAVVVLPAKELFEEEEKEFWEHWEEKPKVISAKEFFKEDDNWWENSSNESSSNEENEDEVTQSTDDLKKSWENVVPAKEFFREDECWWRDAVEDLDKPKVISAKEFFKDEIPWWEQNSSEEGAEDAESGINERRDAKVISAREFFREEDPWWIQNGNGDDSEKGKTEKEKANEDRSEEEEISIYEDMEESVTEDWDTANDSVMSDTSTMYSASEGGKILAADLFAETPWWLTEDSELITDPGASDNEEELSEDKSDKTETTEILDDYSYTERERTGSRARILSSTDSDVSTNVIIDVVGSNSTENLLELDIDEETKDLSTTFKCDLENSDVNVLKDITTSELEYINRENENINSNLTYAKETAENSDNNNMAEITSNLNNFEEKPNSLIDTPRTDARNQNLDLSDSDNILDNDKYPLYEDTNVSNDKTDEDRQEDTSYVNKIEPIITDNNYMNKDTEDYSLDEHQPVIKEKREDDSYVVVDEIRLQEREELKAHLNVVYGSSPVSTHPTNNNSLSKSEAEDEASQMPLDEACQLDINSGAVPSSPHSFNDSEHLDIIQTPTLKLKIKDLKHGDKNPREKSIKSIDEKLVTVKKPVINKMDACLARVDATLAWLDARMANDSLNTCDSDPNLTECDLTPSPLNHSHPNEQNNHLPKESDAKTNNEHQRLEKFQIYKLNVRVPDQNNSKSMDDYMEKCDKNKEPTLRSSCSENALYEDRQRPVKLLKTSRPIPKYNSLAKLETNFQDQLFHPTHNMKHSKMSTEGNFVCISSGSTENLSELKGDKASASTSNICEPVAIEGNSNFGHKRIRERNSSPLVVRRHSMGNIQLSSLPDLRQYARGKKLNADKNSSKFKCPSNFSDLDANPNVLTVRRHSTDGILPNDKHDLECSRNINLKQRNFINNIQEKKLSNQSSTSSLISKNIRGSLPKSKTSLDSNSKESLKAKSFDQDKLDPSNDNVSEIRSKSSNTEPEISTKLHSRDENPSTSFTEDSHDPTLHINQNIEPGIAPKFDLTSTPDLSNWTWSTFHSRSIKEYDKLSSLARDLSEKNHVPLTKTSSLKEPFHSEVKPINESKEENPIKGDSNENLDCFFRTNKRVAESNLKVKPPIPPRRQRDYHPTSKMNQNFNITAAPYKKSDTNELCLSHKLGQTQTTQLDTPESCHFGKQETPKAPEVVSGNSSKNDHQVDVPKPPPRKCPKSSEDVRRSSSCIIC